MSATFAFAFKILRFRKHSGQVYAQLHNHGPATISSIARSLHVHRAVIYRSLKELEARELVEQTLSGKQKLYVAADPSALSSLLKLVAEDLKVTPPTSPKPPPQRSNEPEVHIYRGREGVTKIFNDVVTYLPKGETFYRYTSERDVAKANTYLPPGYRQIRDSKRLERLVISNPVSAGVKRPRLERFIKTISPDGKIFDQNIIQLIYGNRVAFIDLNREMGFIVENAALAEFQKVIFKQLYKRL